MDRKPDSDFREERSANPHSVVQVPASEILFAGHPVQIESRVRLTACAGRKEHFGGFFATACIRKRYAQPFQQDFSFERINAANFENLPVQFCSTVE